MTVLQDRGFHPALGLGSAHIQTILSSSVWRGFHVKRSLDATRAIHTLKVVDAGDGARLQGVLSTPLNPSQSALVVLLHGWEGSVHSNYMRATTAALLAAGYRVFRLNFRDHGDSHHLNPDIFHSARIREVIEAIATVLRDIDHTDLFVGGYSLGGNFALRVGIQGAAKLPTLRRTLAVCPPLNPHHTMRRMETGPRIYINYFETKWRRSLRKKRTLFPERHAFADEVLSLPMRALTQWMVEAHTDFASIEDYFDAYLVPKAALAEAPVRAHILMAADDPVIPVADFDGLDSLPNVDFELHTHGGHCGFLRNWRMQGYAEEWFVRSLNLGCGRS